MGKNTVFYVFCVLLVGTYGAITLNGPKCGQKLCKFTEYCSTIDKSCQNCAVACNTSSHNYEELLCEKECQDYLHDIRYSRKGSNDDDLRGTVERLSRIVTVTLTLTILILLVLAGLLCFLLYRWKLKQNLTFSAITSKCFKRNQTTSPATPNLENRKRDLRLDMPSHNTNTDHSPVTVSTSIERRPAEDSTLDYAAYDNPAMNKSH